MEAFYGILIPFLGTSLGAACVFFLKKTLSDAVQRALTGFAAGVILLTFVGAYGIPAPAELAALQEAVDRVIPCHLASKYLWRWILVREIEGMTLDELQTHKISEFAFEEVQA